MSSVWKTIGIDKWKCKNLKIDFRNRFTYFHLCNKKCALLQRIAWLEKLFSRTLHVFPTTINWKSKLFVINKRLTPPKSHLRVIANIGCCRFAVFDCVALHPLADKALTSGLTKYLPMRHCKRLLAVEAFSPEWRSSFDLTPRWPRPAIFPKVIFQKMLWYWYR